MDGEKMTMKIFILEDEEKFEYKSLKGKVMEVIKRSLEEITTFFIRRKLQTSCMTPGRYLNTG
ncbi:hypothetical protein GVAV_002280 [Gurleya vavrai]